MKNKTYIANIGLVLASAIWGSSFLITKGAISIVSPMVLLSYRFLLAAGIIGAGLKYAKKPLFTNLNAGLLLSLCFSILFISQTIGLEYTSITNSAFITGSFVLFVPVFSYFLNNVFPTKKEIFAASTIIVGLWILTGGLKNVSIGDILTGVTALASAVYISLTKKLIDKNGNIFILNFQQFFFTGIICLVIAILFHNALFINAKQAFLPLLYLSLVPSIVVYLIIFFSQKIISANKASIILSLEPVFATSFALFIGEEKLVRAKIIGGLLIVGGTLLSQLQFKKTI